MLRARTPLIGEVFFCLKTTINTCFVLHDTIRYMMSKDRIKELEALMNEANFWDNKAKAQEVLNEYKSLKGGGEETNNPAIINIIAGSGGDDSEDFVSMLLNMYVKYCESKGLEVFELDKHENTKGGYKNISIEVNNKGAYNLFKNEAGVHRLVRMSPFNSKKQRHTSFALVDVIPKLKDLGEVNIPESDLEIEFTNAGGPGGQNVNKRETAVRIKHIPTKIAVRVDKERSQLQNRETALCMLRGKLFSLMKQQRIEELRDISSNNNQSIEWGNQVRSYVLHPYKLVKDSRIDFESTDPEGVLDGKLDPFIEALKDYNN